MRKALPTFFIVILCACTAYLFLEGRKFVEMNSAFPSVETTTVLETKTNIVATSSLSDEKLSPSKIAESKPLSANTPEKKPFVSPVRSTSKAAIPAVSVTPRVSAPAVSPAPTPLVHVPDVPSLNGVVKEDEILTWTNYYREQNGLHPLTGNSKLDSAALVKVNDMLARQYFEHVSPSGKDGSDLVKDAGYEYILMGENLAYGNFTDAKDLVDAWMASPGHRANILKEHFEEIGISAIEGNFGGRKVWMAVQEFGRPASSCPLPEKAVKDQIDSDEAAFSTYMIEANDMVARMDAYKASGDYRSYNDLVPEYNALVGKMNTLAEKIRVMVGNYNWQIGEYKKCVGE